MSDMQSYDDRIAEIRRKAVTTAKGWAPEAGPDSGPAPGSGSLPAGTEVDRQMDALFEEWWVKDRDQWIHRSREAARFVFMLGFLAGRESQKTQPAVTPNDKLSGGKTP